jgi:hypothetical protein
MDVDQPQGGLSSAHGNAGASGPGGGAVTQHAIAITPINPNPMTPRGKEIVEEV